MAGDIDSGKYHLNSGELDLHNVRGVYFPEPINSSEIGVLYLKDGMVNTAKIEAFEFCENYGKVHLGSRKKLINYALRTIDSLKKENADSGEDLLHKLSGLTLKTYTLDFDFWRVLINTEIGLEDNGMTKEEIGGFDEEVEDLAIRCIGEGELNKMFDGVVEKYENEIKPKIMEYKSKLGESRQQTEELNKLQVFYQSIQ